MAIARRVKRLEQVAGIGMCPVCQGEGKRVVSKLMEHDPVPEVQGCPRCGKANHCILRFVDESPNRMMEVEEYKSSCVPWDFG